MWKQNFGLHLCQAKYGVISFSVGGRVGGSETHFGFGIFEIWWNFENLISGYKHANMQTTILMHRHHSDQISRSAR